MFARASRVVTRAFTDFTRIGSLDHGPWYQQVRFKKRSFNRRRKKKERRLRRRRRIWRKNRMRGLQGNLAEIRSELLSLAENRTIKRRKRRARDRRIFSRYVHTYQRRRMVKRKKKKRWIRPRIAIHETNAFWPGYVPKPSHELGPDALYKYKPTPFHVRSPHFATHPRPIESNLTTGNEKTADKYLPPDYLDRYFNSPKLPISERVIIPQPDLHYNIHEYKRRNLYARLLARLFHVYMPEKSESLLVPNGTRRLRRGVNHIWVNGCWIDRREINDFFTYIGLCVFMFGVVIAKQQLDVERTQGQLIQDRDTHHHLQMIQKKRLIMDSDRTKKPEFQVVEPPPKNPLYD